MTRRIPPPDERPGSPENADQPTTDPVASVDVIRRALMGYFPLNEFVHVHEAATAADRSGRKLDVVCFGTWRSRGLERVGIEIKRSIADLRAELRDPDKADWWVEHTHRFFIAAPSPIASLIKANAMLPHGWGLLAISTSNRVTQTIAPAQRKDPKPLPEEAIVGILRAAGDTGPGALQRRFDDGVKAGRKQAEASRVGMSAESYDGELDRLRTAHSELRAAVDEFQRKTGITISSYQPKSADRFNAAVELLRNMSSAASQIERTIETFERPVVEMRRLVEMLREPIDP